MTNLKKLTVSVLLATVPLFGASAADIEKINTDVVVVGGGGTGLSAAASAHQHGAKVILLEKLAFVGGSSALSGGALAAGESNPQKRAECSVRLLTAINSGVDRHQFRPSSVRNWSMF